VVREPRKRDIQREREREREIEKQREKDIGRRIYGVLVREEERVVLGSRNLRCLKILGSVAFRGLPSLRRFLPREN
jgi:hypothetical protein